MNKLSSMANSCRSSCKSLDEISSISDFLMPSSVVDNNGNHDNLPEKEQEVRKLDKDEVFARLTHAINNQRPTHVDLLDGSGIKLTKKRTKVIDVKGKQAEIKAKTIELKEKVEQMKKIIEDNEGKGNGMIEKLKLFSDKDISVHEDHLARLSSLLPQFRTTVESYLSESEKKNSMSVNKIGEVNVMEVGDEEVEKMVGLVEKMEAFVVSKDRVMNHGMFLEEKINRMKHFDDEC